MIIFYMQQLLHLYHNNIVDLFVIDTSWKKKTIPWHKISLFWFTLSFCTYLLYDFCLWKEHWMYKCITFLRRRHPLPFDTRRFLKREEILTHHISNSMLNLIHERNTQSEKNITPLQQQKEMKRDEEHKDGNIFCIVEQNWCNFAWSIIMVLNH